MAEKRDYKIGELYQGGYSTLDPKKNEFFTGYNATAGSLGITTDPRTANVIKDMSTKLAGGSKHIELALISPELFDSVPKQQLKEVNRMAKLTGAEVSIHGPVSGVSPAGITQQGWSELNRENVERKIANFVERSAEVNPEGNTTIVFHSAEGIGSSQWEEIPDAAAGKEGKAKLLMAVDRDSGKMIPLDKEIKYYPGGKKEEGYVRKKEHTPEYNLEVVNDTQWSDSIDQLIFNKERADEILRENEIPIRHLFEDLSKKEDEKGRINRDELTPTQREAWNKFTTAKGYLDDTMRHVQSIFNKAYKYGTDEQREVLNELSKNYSKRIEESKDIIGQSNAMQELLADLNQPGLAPNQFVPIEDFAVEQSAITFGNAAFKAYDKLGDKAPIIAIENPPAGFGLSTGEDLRNLVKASREHFAEKLVEEGKSKNEAAKIAEKFIGATWDVGHINMLRGQGFSEEDIIKETEKIAPYLKHVHLSDNFGFEHTELPMGMGNVPMKKIMEKLGQKGYDAKKVIEAGTWWQHFQTNPVKESMEGLGSAIYSEGTGPYWNQSLGFQQGYLGGYGMMLPQTNYETFGAGFSRLPTELGGSVGGGAGGRMGGGRE